MRSTRRILVGESEGRRFGVRAGNWIKMIIGEPVMGIVLLYIFIYLYHLSGLVAKIAGYTS
jgi:hypothetical protein